MLQSSYYALNLQKNPPKSPKNPQRIPKEPTKNNKWFIKKSS